MGKCYASKKECETLWGKRKSNNGFRYTTHEDESLRTRIETLIRQVYQRKQTTNSDITLTFALGVLAERKGFSINWAKFAETVHRRKRSFSPLPEYKNGSSSQDGSEEEEEDEEDEEDDEEDEEDEEEEEKEEEEDDTHGDEDMLHEDDATEEKHQGGDELCGSNLQAVGEKQGDEEAAAPPQTMIDGGTGGDQLHSPRQEVVSKDAPTVCIGDEQLGLEAGSEEACAEEVAAQFENNAPHEKVQAEGDTHGARLGEVDVAPGGEHYATPPLVREGLEMPSTLGTEIDDNSLLVMEKAVRLKEVKLREDQVKFKRELLQFKIG
jgi:hypothetical protein